MSAEGVSLEVVRANYKPKDPHGVLAATKALERAYERGDGQGIAAAEKKIVAALAASRPGDIGEEQLQPLVRAGEAAARRSEWRLLGLVLAILALGIPLLIDVITKSKAERVVDAYERLSTLMTLEADMLLPSEDGDIADHMNLLAAHALKESTASVLALGAPFPQIHRAIARHSYSQSEKINPKDFERSAGVLLIHEKSGELLSLHDEQLSLCIADGKSAYQDADGHLRFSDGTRVAEGAKIEWITVQPGDVGARFRSASDPGLRPGMVYPWRGTNKALVDVSWWGQCHASGMLGSLGVPPARSVVQYYDEATGTKALVNAEQITSLLVLYGDRSFEMADKAAHAGRLNKNSTRIDADSPEVFHTFVSKQIAANMPFNLESHSLDQVWNYPVANARIRPLERERRTFGGFRTRYEMRLVKSNGEVATYFYTLTTNRDGKVTGSQWDDEANNQANGKAHQVPDVLVAYVSAESPSNWLTPYDYFGQQFGFDDRAAQIILDLYFASRQGSGEEVVYAVRRKDGTLERVSDREFRALP